LDPQGHLAASALERREPRDLVRLALLQVPLERGQCGPVLESAGELPDVEPDLRGELLLDLRPVDRPPFEERRLPQTPEVLPPDRDPLALRGLHRDAR